MSQTAKSTSSSIIEQNLAIQGDNLSILGALADEIKGKVQCVIVDPPYAFPKEALKSADGDWQTFLRPRIEACRAALSDSGAAFIHADDAHLANVRLLADEIFGNKNFLNMVILKTADPSGLRSINPLPFNQTEYLLIYTKDRKSFTYYPQFVEAGYDSAYRSIVLNPEAPYGKWKTDSLPRHLAKMMGYRSVRQAREKMGLNFEQHMADYALKNAAAVFQSTRVNQRAGSAVVKLGQASHKKPKTMMRLERKDYSDIYMVGGRQLAFYATKLNEVDGRMVPTKKLTNLWIDIPFHGVGYEGEAKFAEGKKPERLVRRILSMCTQPGDLVLDPFAGSGTTAATCEKLGRRWLVIDNDRKNLDNLIVPRLTRVVNGLDDTGLSKVMEYPSGGSFKRLNYKGGTLVDAGQVMGSANTV
ncbi:MAG: site-specific DNA-methyltransferase [Myxococcota bacterium]|nr:site-specific DNA-methyltransferase [Myxococcota bacterium]